MRRVYRIVYTATARSDLLAIGDTIREAAGPRIAERFIERVITTADSLSDMPERHRLGAELADGFRAISVGKYLIFYVVDDETVSIIRVLHGARDITAKLLGQ